MLTHEPPVLFSIDLSGCDSLKALSSDEVIATFAAALTRAGATVVETASHIFPGTGITSVLILSESHAVLHTWPETGTVNIDVFSCSPKLKVLDAVAELSQFFGSSSVTSQEIVRADGHLADRPAFARA